ncbi:MAG: CYTH domain-containing protein, partial [Flavobacteriales bacterium]|nr:CYTH domain-containing protein [Flavobacteriales bacterium]
LSDIALYKSQEPKALKQLLDASLKTIVVVDKQREIYFIDHIKIHVDEVLNLGDFLEIEVIDKTDTMEVETMHQECNELMKKFNLDASLLLRNSYSDMLMSKV